MRADKAYDELLRRVREETLLTTIDALLEWDGETYMPAGGVENRSEQMALVAGLLHDRGTDPRIGDLLSELIRAGFVMEVGRKEKRGPIAPRKEHRAHVLELELLLPQALFSQDGVIHFLAVNADRFGGADAESHFVASNIDDGDLDVIPNDDRLIPLSGQY